MAAMAQLAFSPAMKMGIMSAVSLGMSGIAVGVGGIYYPEKAAADMDSGIVDAVVLTEPPANQQELSNPSNGYVKWTRSESFGGKVSSDSTSTQLIYHLFNVTNPEDVLWGKERAKLKECGPYVYNVRGEKFDVSFDNALGTVSYKVHERLEFVPEASVGDPRLDRIVTVNIPYAQILVNLHKYNQTETYLVGRFGHEALVAYQQYLLGPFLAKAKREALPRYLTSLYAELRRREVPRELATRYPEWLTASVPSTLTSLNAKMRTLLISSYVRQIFLELNVVGIWSALSSYFRRIRRNAVPRVLSGLHTRLQTDALPQLLQQQLVKQRYYHVPMRLREVHGLVAQQETPAVLTTVLADVSYFAVPTVLSDVIEKLVASMAGSSNPALARTNMAQIWNKNENPIDITPIMPYLKDGATRNGFELNPTGLVNKSVPSGVAQYLLQRSNSWSFLNRAGSYADSPAKGWWAWQRLAYGVPKVSQLEYDAIAQAVIAGLAAEMPGTGITLEQVDWVAAYLRAWAVSSNDVVIQERLYKWTTGLDGSEPSTTAATNLVPLETTAVPGFELTSVTVATELSRAVSRSAVAASVTPAVTTALGATMSGAAAKYLWTASNAYSFLNSTSGYGFSVWLRAMGGYDEDEAVFTTLAAAHAGLTEAHIHLVVAWLNAIQQNSVLLKIVNNKWALLNATDSWTSASLGFGVGPYYTDSNASLVVSTQAASYLWASAKTYSFVNVPLVVGSALTYSASTSSALLQGYWIWLAASRTSPIRDAARAALLASLNKELAAAGAGSFTAAQVEVVSNWLEAAQSNGKTHEAVLRRWAQATCKAPIVTRTSTTKTTSGASVCPVPTAVIEAASGLGDVDGTGYWGPSDFIVNYTSFIESRSAPVLASQFPTSTANVTNTTTMTTCHAYNETRAVTFSRAPVHLFWVQSGNTEVDITSAFFNISYVDELSSPSNDRGILKTPDMRYDVSAEEMKRVFKSNLKLVVDVNRSVQLPAQTSGQKLWKYEITVLQICHGGLSRGYFGRGAPSAPRDTVSTWDPADAYLPKGVSGGTVCKNTTCPWLNTSHSTPTSCGWGPRPEKNLNLNFTITMRAGGQGAPTSSTGLVPTAHTATVQTGEALTLPVTTTLYNVTTRTNVERTTQSSCETMAYRDGDAAVGVQEAQLRVVPYWQGRYATASGGVESLQQRSDGWNPNCARDSPMLSPSTTTSLYLWDITKRQSFLRVPTIAANPADSVYNITSHTSDHMPTATLAGYPLWRMAGVELKKAVDANSPGTMTCVKTNSTHPMRRSQLRTMDSTAWKRVLNSTSGKYTHSNVTTTVVLENGCDWNTYTAPCGVTSASTVATVSAAAGTSTEGGDYSPAKMCSHYCASAAFRAATDELLCMVPGLEMQQLAAVASWLEGLSRQSSSSAGAGGLTTGDGWSTIVEQQLLERWRAADGTSSQGGAPGLAPLDLQPSEAGLQGGWEVHMPHAAYTHGGNSTTTTSSTVATGSSSAAATSATTTVTLSASRYLWNASNVFSFLNENGGSTTAPQGYTAWVQASMSKFDDSCLEICPGVYAGTQTCEQCIALAQETLRRGLYDGLGCAAWKAAADASPSSLPPENGCTALQVGNAGTLWDGVSSVAVATSSSTAATCGAAAASGTAAGTAASTAAIHSSWVVTVARWLYAFSDNEQTRRHVLQRWLDDTCKLPSSVGGADTSTATIQSTLAKGLVNAACSSALGCVTADEAREASNYYCSQTGISGGGTSDTAAPTTSMGLGIEGSGGFGGDTGFGAGIDLVSAVFEPRALGSGPTPTATVHNNVEYTVPNGGVTGTVYGIKSPQKWWNASSSTYTLESCSVTNSTASFTRTDGQVVTTTVVTTTRKVKRTTAETVEYSCDVVDLDSNIPGLQAGFELDPLRKYNSTGKGGGGKSAVSLEAAMKIFDSSHAATLITEKSFQLWKGSYEVS
jgi:hypothetical protein